MKKIILCIAIVVVVCYSLSLAMGYTKVIYLSSNKEDEIAFQKGEVVSLLKGFNFDKGNWKAYLIIDKDDRKSVPLALRKANCFATSDIKVLKGMQTDWRMIITGGDMSTVESHFILVNDGVVKLRIGIVPDEGRCGFQSETFGWEKRCILIWL